MVTSRAGRSQTSEILPQNNGGCGERLRSDVTDPSSITSLHHHPQISGFSGCERHTSSTFEHFLPACCYCADCVRTQRDPFVKRQRFYQRSTRKLFRRFIPSDLMCCCLTHVYRIHRRCFVPHQHLQQTVKSRVMFI
ncbi:hypothetical protein QQF64_014297 [Cirrhinus molitorella]|uniref:Uncharacterized protein n=1 Tax=Cirrhinus molitorella TaxID=172907 RepID=A0ABR3NS62_9TELE